MYMHIHRQLFVCLCQWLLVLCSILLLHGFTHPILIQQTLTWGLVGGDFQFPATAPGAAALGVVLLADFLGFLPVCGCAFGLGAKKCC